MQQKPFEIHKAPLPPLRAEPRLTAPSGGAGHIQGVQTTSGGLIRSTMLAGGGALAILVLFWLPAEYGVDPTGLGGILGLTEMGEIKTQLAGEAAAQDAAAAANPAVPAEVTLSSDVVRRLDGIEAQLQQIAVVIGADIKLSAATPPPVPEPEPAPEIVTPEPAAIVPAVVEPAPVPETASGWRDEVVFTLAPTEAKEIKLVMAAGEVATFEWVADGTGVNYSQHGDDGAEQEVRFEEGRAAPGQEGTMTAPFAGNHGWFYRNRGDAPVTVTLRVTGGYSELIEVE